MWEIFDAKIIVIGGLFLALIVAKLTSGGRPFDGPVRRRRRFGRRGTMSPLRNPEAYPQAPPVDPEKEFFGKE